MTPTYRYRIKGFHRPPEIIRAASELNAADAYFSLHGACTIEHFERVPATITADEMRATLARGRAGADELDTRLRRIFSR